ncbi:MAG TPA: DoxX family protein [Acidimicrobiales bacterium]|nr:DoxX family protein [Acidimicrobiales bacterium]
MHVMVGTLTASSVDTALLIARVALGAVFLAHGINHIIGGGKIVGTARWFEGLGMKPGILHAWTASLTEVGAGGLMVLGLLTPVAGAGIVGVMLVAWITNHRKNGFFIFRPGEGWEYVMILTVLGTFLGTIGPGDWSVDGHVSTLTRLWGWPGFAIALGGGALGAAALLVTFWRPAPKTDA